MSIITFTVFWFAMFIGYYLALRLAVKVTVMQAIITSVVFAALTYFIAFIVEVLKKYVEVI